MMNEAEVREMVRRCFWDESKHPRHPAGDSRGGEFAPKGTGAYTGKVGGEGFTVNLPGYGNPREGSTSIVGIHHSGSVRSELDTSKYGSGMSGGERDRVEQSFDKRLRQRAYFYVDTGSGVVDQEPGVGMHVHGVRLDNVYDLSADAQGLVKKAREHPEWSVNPYSAIEATILDAGFDGYVTDFGKGRAAVVLGEHRIPVRYLGRGKLGFTWDESAHPRGKTSDASTPGSFAPRGSEQAMSAMAKELKSMTKTVHGHYPPTILKDDSAYIDVSPFELNDPNKYDPQALFINYIEAKTPGKGDGSKALDQIVALADKHGVVLKLTASEMDSKGGPSQKKLMEWYATRGFKHVEGTESDMVRSPRASFKEWDESKVNRGKTSAESTPGSFAPKEGSSSRTDPSKVSKVAAQVPRDERGVLTPEQVAAEDRLADFVGNHYEEAVAKYNAHPDTQGGKLLNTDIARELSEDYLADRAGMAAAVHEPASYFIKRRYAELLAQAPAEGEMPMVLFTAGGAGAGKSYAVGKTIDDLAGQAQIIYDTNMAGAASGMRKIEQALSAGKDVTIAYIHRDVYEAFAEGAVPRAIKQETKFGTGRTVMIDDFLETHYGARDALDRVSAHYNGNSRVQFIAIKNTRAEGRTYVAPIGDIPKLDRNQYATVKQRAIDYITTERDSGRLSESIYKGFFGREGGGGKGRHGFSQLGKAAGRAHGGGTEQGHAGGCHAVKVSFNAPKRVSFSRGELRQMLVRAEQRVDFAVINARATALEVETAQRVARVAARGVKRLLVPERMSELLSTDVDSIGEVRLDSTDIGAIKKTFREMLEQSWSTGLMQAMDETSKVRKVLYKSEERKVKFAALRDNAAAFFEANAFRMAGNLTDTMRAVIQGELLKAVKQGIRPEDTAVNIYVSLIRKGILTLEAVLAEEARVEIRERLEELLGDALAQALGTVNVPAYLNTLARTNTYEALNEARYAEFTAPEMSEFVLALQYSAILDDRTTVICSTLDRSIYAVDNPLWEVYRPPNHYNCRSLLVAVTALDDWDGMESDPPSVEPQEGFK